MRTIRDTGDNHDNPPKEYVARDTLEDASDALPPGAQFVWLTFDQVSDLACMFVASFVRVCCLPWGSSMPRPHTPQTSSSANTTCLARSAAARLHHHRQVEALISSRAPHAQPHNLSSAVAALTWTAAHPTAAWPSRASSWRLPIWTTLPCARGSSSLRIAAKKGRWTGCCPTPAGWWVIKEILCVHMLRHPRLVAVVYMT